MNNNYGLIMAGGIGSRFWPMSTPDHPKQFLDILGIGKSLLQLTYQRLLDFIPEDQIIVLTNKSYQELVKKQLPNIHLENIICEPKRKNTAPCIAYASAKIYSKNPNATLVILPSDHLILNEKRFTEIILKGIEVAKENKDLVTLGIEPTRPDTGYGYIEFDYSMKGEFGKATKVLKFREKPNLETANEFLNSGNYFWNAGIFIWNAKTILEALQTFQPKLADIFIKGNAYYYTGQENDFVEKAFDQCEDISIDYAVLEHAENVSMVLSDFDWSDLGTWGSLKSHLQTDDFNNSIIGKSVFLFDSKNCLVNVSNDKLILLDGLNDYIVVESDNKFMVLKSENEQKLKDYLNSVL